MIESISFAMGTNALHTCMRVVVLSLCLAGCDDADRPAGTADVDTGAGLIGWWTFDDGNGATAADSSGFGNTATIRGGQWGTGRSGGGLQMDGGNDGIVIVPLSESLESTSGEITVMSWTYRTDEHNVAVVAHEYPTLFFGFHGPQFKWQIQGAGGRGVVCYAGRKHRAVLGKWIHMAATYDGWRARLYVDGVEICSRFFWGSIGMPDSPFTISGFLGSSNEIVDEITGTLDDIRIYNRALEPEDIRAVYLRELQREQAKSGEKSSSPSRAPVSFGQFRVRDDCKTLTEQAPTSIAQTAVAGTICAVRQGVAATSRTMARRASEISSLAPTSMQRAPIPARQS